MTSVELQRLVDRSEPGKAPEVDGVLGGVERRLVLLSSMPPVGRGAVLAVAPEDTEPPTGELELAAQLWHVLSTDAGQRAADPARTSWPATSRRPPHGPRRSPTSARPTRRR